MPLTLDAEIAAVLAATAAAAGEIPAAAHGSALELRAQIDVMLAGLNSMDPESPDVATKDYEIPVASDSSILARWYTKSGSNPAQQ
ncbi:hypothetical protein [Arthrobacter sp. ISL-95]|uniref:hypothetical protein n=1 Tax=Arthrobacter sp. ISL-95 TaxID=2819116 RepID=UPI001BE68970|nr:hypothetical protein [Arthrobacter sp. ISL-95]MBT2587816.1 hypothetical protein [Arthrobacter sp. ISL-95]